MLTPQDVRSVQFEKNLRGYRTEDVDRFLDKVEEQLQQNDAQAEQLRKQIADLTAENQKLKGELQSFEADGDMLKSALINAQRMGENVIREANQKAEEIIHRANLRGDDIIRDANELLQKASDRADEIENEANEKRLAVASVLAYQYFKCGIYDRCLLTAEQAITLPQEAIVRTRAVMMTKKVSGPSMALPARLKALPARSMSLLTRRSRPLCCVCCIFFLKNCFL